MRVKKSVVTNFAFLGSRQYVTGATITNDLLAIIHKWPVGRIKQISATFSHLVTTQCYYELWDGKAQDKPSVKNYAAVFELTSDQGIYLILLNPEKEPIKSRIAYDEDELTDLGEIDEKNRTASIILKPTDPLINVMVALNKKMLTRLLPQKGYGMWILVKYDLKGDILSIYREGMLKLKFNAAIGGIGTRTAIEFDSKPAGTMYFSREKIQ